LLASQGEDGVTEGVFELGEGDADAEGEEEGDADAEGEEEGEGDAEGEEGEEEA
jgi:hypothetical protein